MCFRNFFAGLLVAITFYVGMISVAAPKRLASVDHPSLAEPDSEFTVQFENGLQAK